MAEVDDYKAFGDLLSKRKFETGKSFDQLAQELGVSVPTINGWHPPRYSLPSKAEKLPVIAQVYALPLEELEIAYNLVKGAQRRLGTKTRAGKKIKHYRPASIEPAEVYGGIADRSVLTRSNSQLRSWKVGRS